MDRQVDFEIPAPSLTPEQEALCEALARDQEWADEERLLHSLLTHDGPAEEVCEIEERMAEREDAVRLGMLADALSKGNAMDDATSLRLRRLDHLCQLAAAFVSAPPVEDEDYTRPELSAVMLYGDLCEAVGDDLHDAPLLRQIARQGRWISPPRVA